MPLLQVRDLCLTLPTRNGPIAVVEGLSFDIDEQDSLALVGESGCGKSLTALAIMGLLPPAISISAGSIQFRGRELVGCSDRQWRRFRGGAMAMVFQEPIASLNPVLRIATQIEEVLALHGDGDRRWRKRQAVSLLEQVGLPDPAALARAYPHELSGGMCQRVLLAMALAGEPDLLIADEPTTALDVTVQAQILDLLIEIRRQRGLAFLWISHDLGVVSRLCDRVAVMYAGKLVEQQPVQTLFGNPRHPYTRGLMAASPSLEQQALPTGIPGRVPAPEDFTAGCRFRDRCSQAMELCFEDPPAFPLESEDAWVRCFLMDTSATSAGEALSNGEEAK